MKSFVTRLHKEIEHRTMEIRELARERETLQDDLRGTQYSAEYKAETIRPRLKTLDIAIRKEKEALSRQAEAMINEEAENIRRRYTVRPKELTNDIKLLELGIVSERDLDEMIERNRGNYTMMQYIARWVDNYNKNNPLNAYSNHVPRYTTYRDAEIRALGGIQDVVDLYTRNWSDKPYDDSLKVLDRFFEPIYRVAEDADSKDMA